MDIKEKIGDRIKELRYKEGVSQEVFADMAHLDRTYINSVENGKRNISIVNIEKISKAFNLTPAQFFNCKIFK